MRFLGRSLTGLFLVFLTIGVLAWAGQITYAAFQAAQEDGRPSRPQAERTYTASVVAFNPAEEIPVLTSFGEVQSRRSLDLRTPVGGRLIELSPTFDEGQRVSAGEILARIDPADAQSSLDLAKTDLSEAELDRQNAFATIELAQDELSAAQAQAVLQERALDRQKDLRQRGVGTDSAVEAAELSAASAEQSVLSRRQALQQAEARYTQLEPVVERRALAVKNAERLLDQTIVTAEFDGQLFDVNVAAGGFLTANERLATLIDPQVLEVAFRVSTAQYLRVLNDDGTLPELAVDVTLDVFGTDLTTSAKLTREGAAVSEGVTGRLLFAEIEQPKGLRPGDFVTVAIQEQPIQNVARLPALALGSEASVLVLGDEDRLEEVPVELLRRQGDEVLVRARGIAGREVVANRSPLLGPGIKIKPLRIGPEAAIPAEPDMVELEDDRREKLIAFVTENRRMPDEVKERLLSRLEQPSVPAGMVERLESRMSN